MDDLIPVLMKLGFFIEAAQEQCESAYDQVIDDELWVENHVLVQTQDAKFEYDSILENLLKLVTKVDYSDEMGRRNTHQVICKTLLLLVMIAKLKKILLQSDCLKGT